MDDFKKRLPLAASALVGLLLNPSLAWAAGTSSTTPSSKGATADSIKTNQSTALKLLMLDSSQLDLKLLGESISNLRKLITNQPDNAYLHFKLGTLLYLAGDCMGAAGQLKHAIDLSPNDVCAQAQLAKVLDLIGDHEQAVLVFRKACESTNIPDIQVLFAESLMRGGNAQEAAKQYRQALATIGTTTSTPSQAPILAGLSEAMLSAGDQVGAMKAARKAVSADPSSSYAQVALTFALLTAGDKASASRTARQAVLLNPNSAKAHIALGRSLHANGDYDSAADEFKQAVNLDPLNPQAHNDLGYALYGAGEVLLAVNEYRLALRLNPHLNEARNNLEVAIFGLAHSQEQAKK
jgi:Flp pilus assembly protein TadD